MSADTPVAGIDLGTTNSEIAVYVDGKVEVLKIGGNELLPSCVSLSPDGELLVGEAARNQQVLYPERTVRSVKRLMGSDEIITLGGKTFSPQEISALILRELVRSAERRLQTPVTKAVITVPAYFSDAQRQATHEAGQLAGLEVARILNEPTAASLAYGYGGTGEQTLMVYDLGGGTFDVSIVTIEGDVTEVLASHGNNKLGGDDFDELLVGHLMARFQEEHGADLRDAGAKVKSRLWRAAEEAKKRLSYEPYAQVREETLLTVDGKPLHLDIEVSQEEYEEMIAPLVESTLFSVSKALDDAGKKPGELDGILLVGGSTRTPLVSRVLEERTALEPRKDVHPDLCVALGAGVLASRIAGHDVEQVLVDVSPYSFGISHLGEFNGREYAYCYHPIIERNTPLPVTRTERYWTSRPFQERVDVNVFQGDDYDALKNILVGDFQVEGLTPMSELNEVLCRMSLDLDGILHVTAIERITGMSKHVRIANAAQTKTDKEIAAGRMRLAALFGGEGYAIDVDAEPVEVDGASEETDFLAGRDAAAGLLDRSRALLDTMHDEDKEEAIDLHERIEAALEARDVDALEEAAGLLEELLFFVEGR